MNTSSLPRWDLARIALLALCFSGTVAIVAKQAIAPETSQKKTGAEFTFPDQVQLKNWQQIKSGPLKIKEATERKNKFPQHRYIYKQGNKDLIINTVYETATDGNVSRLLNVYEQIPPATVVISEKYRPEVGHFGTFEYKDRAFLSACINPKGDTTITQKQFVQNRYFHTGSLPRFAGWIAGRNDLFDGRCLWVSLSVPVNTFAAPAELKRSKDLLESASMEWIERWKQNYPES